LDLEEIQHLQAYYHISPTRIILMPEGRSAVALDEKAVWLADRCREYGFRLGDRLHVRLWGDRRGV